MPPAAGASVAVQTHSEDYHQGMYERFFGLRERPFDLAPNPRFLYLARRHREALSHLRYGLTTPRGFTLLLGEAGTGKTTLVRTILAEMKPDQVECVLLSNPTLTRAEFLEFLTDGFKLSPECAHSKVRLIDELRQHLVARHEAGQLTALVLDEAQSLPYELLEEVRLLSNIEEASTKLLNVVLVGQPELADRLNESELRQLKQRISLRCELGPLDLPDTAAYVAGRIRIAGGNPDRDSQPGSSHRDSRSLSGRTPHDQRRVRQRVDRRFCGTSPTGTAVHRPRSHEGLRPRAAQPVCRGAGTETITGTCVTDRAVACGSTRCRRNTNGRNQGWRAVRYVPAASSVFVFLVSQKAMLKRSQFVFLATLACLLLSATRVPAQSTAPAGRPPAATSKPGSPPIVGPSVAVSPDFVVGPEDVLGILFWREAEMSGDVTVRPDGRITLPLLGDLQAEGMRPDALRDEIQKVAAKYLTDPNVTVVVRTINSRKVFITGLVATPGTFPLTGPRTVMQLISLAGGLAEYAKSEEIQVIRGAKAFKFNYKDVSKGKKLEQNILLQPGDTVVVP